ncbi:uncharacterized protein LOC114362146 [Ostrinia furnacalis]|uniref:uncharacterized protein LOC114362146 n=1 Tax=Ostrinia furnacalis TaxID=93504 RepID=UPI001038A8A6|nr:uncharacterized protein LOC114362146 [Ostrinia furnacalis]
MSWSNDTVLEFIELYKKEQILWDPKHPLHRNRSEITDAWLRIQMSLSINCTIPDLKKKKESLMTSFRMHLNKKKNQEGYHTPWFAYPLMESFLGGRYECDSTNQMESEFFDTSYNSLQVSDHKSRTTAHCIRINADGSPYKPAGSAAQSQSKCGTEIYIKKNPSDTSKLIKNNAEKREADEYDLYGQLLAKKLRKLDEHQRDVTMHEIDNIMFRAKMQSSSQAGRYSPPSPAQRKVKSPVFIVTHSQSRLEYEDENVPYQDQLQTQPPS